MKNLLLILILLLAIGKLHAQDNNPKNEKMKVVIVKKHKDDHGKIIEERIETEGDEALDLMKKLENDKTIVDLDIEMSIGDMKINTKGEKGKSFSFQMRNNNDADKNFLTMESEGENIIIKTDKDGEEEVMHWIINEDENDEDYKKIKIKVEKEREDLPELTVNMGVKLADHGNVKIVEVENDSPAQRAGLLSDDIITEIDGYHVGDYSDLVNTLAKYKPGDKVKVRYIRDGKAKETKLKFRKS